MTDKVKERLIAATCRLLQNCADVSDITARKIAAEAETTLGMIKYYFNSKDALVNVAVNTLLADRADQYHKIVDGNLPPVQKLIEFLSEIADIAVEYSRYTKPMIPYCMLNEPIEEPYYILPLVKECLPHRTETECRVIAYQLTSFTNLVFYRSEDFQKYAGVDFKDSKQRKTFFVTMVGLYMKDDDVSETEGEKK